MAENHPAHNRQIVPPQLTRIPYHHKNLSFFAQSSPTNMAKHPTFAPKFINLMTIIPSCTDNMLKEHEKIFTKVMVQLLHEKKQTQRRREEKT